MKNTQRNLLEIVDVEAGWIAALPIPKAEAVPLFIEELRGKGYEVKDEIEETVGGHVVRYRPGHKHEQKEDKPMSTQMQADAIAKLRAEMEGNANPYVPVIGNYLISHLESNPQDAEKILSTDKTLGKCWTAMKTEAGKKPKFENAVMMTYEEGFAIVLKYFGIKSDGPVAVLAAPTPPSAPSSPSNDSDLDIDLTDFM